MPDHGPGAQPGSAPDHGPGSRPQAALGHGPASEHGPGDDSRPGRAVRGRRILFGGDYNPEQWDDDVLAEDDVLMRRARVTAATVGVFSWSCLEPEEGRYDFGWLDRTMDRLHAVGVRVVLATPTASPPPWFTVAHPDALPVTPEGTRLWHGSRDTYCVAAPAYRAAALRIATALAERYADHPALALWHLHNEYGTLCWCDHVAAAFRVWLRRRHGEGRDGLESLNQAWNTAFWSQRYTSWEHVLPPRATPYLHNPAQVLDFRRFFSDELLAAYREQRDAVRRFTPDVPVTTNFMLPDYQNLDFWRWSREVDVVAVDHYLATPDPEGRADLAFGADRARSFNGGRPWLLMEQAPNLVFDAGILRAKTPGRMLGDSLAYLARGSDAVMFFQWRPGRTGSEVHHSAMVPHAGADTRVFREVVELGETLGRLDEVVGSTLRADVAILWDADAWWALEAPGSPSPRMRYLDALRQAHHALWRAGVVTDFAHPEDDLSRYRLVLAPSAYLLSDAAAASLSAYVDGGGHLFVGCFSGVVDATGRTRLGGYPGGLRDVLGIRVEEFRPLADGEEVVLARAPAWPAEGRPDGAPDQSRDDAPDGARDGGLRGRLWSEYLHAPGAEVLAGYRGGVLDGQPAVTRNRWGTGTGWYCSTRLRDDDLAALLAEVGRAAGVAPTCPGLPEGVEAVRRLAPDGRSWLFAFNDSGAAVEVPARGVELLTGAVVTGAVEVQSGGVAVVRETG